jgi:hypothetical protein
MSPGEFARYKAQLPLSAYRSVPKTTRQTASEEATSPQTKEPDVKRQSSMEVGIVPKKLFVRATATLLSDTGIGPDDKSVADLVALRKRKRASASCSKAAQCST